MNTLCLPIECLELRLFFKSVSMYSLYFTVEIFYRLGPIVFVLLIRGFHVKYLVCFSLLHIYFYTL